MLAARTDEPGRLYVNFGDGSFNPVSIAAFEQDRECEDTAAVFFDADGDGDRDLLRCDWQHGTRSESCGLSRSTLSQRR